MSDYLKQWSSATPGYLIFLIDQSSSMSQIWTKNISKADYTADIVNKTINELIASNAAGESVKDRVFVSLIGYGGNYSVNNLRSDYLSKYADSPIKIEQSTKQIKNGDGYIDMNIEMPIFLESEADGLTPMGGAFDLAKRLIQGWIEKKQNHPVPVIINISDGQPEGPDRDSTELEIKKTIMFANDIMKLKMDDGFPLIFNVHISNTNNEIQFPENEYELNGDVMAELLFKISSKVPDTYKKAAKDQNLKRIGEKSKGFISNASPETLIRFINFGSSAASRSIL
jgi:hypothetical protein